MESLSTFLDKKYSPSTVKSYEIAIAKYLVYNPTAALSTYTEVMDYIGHLRKRQKRLNLILSAIKQYYQWLVATEQRSDNPAAAIRLRDKGKRAIQYQDLFSSGELELLLERIERYSVLTNRNKFIMSLLIYQGLTSSEISALALGDINFEKGVLKIRASRRLNSRTLELKSKQLYWLMEYQNRERPELVKQSKTPSEKLILNKLGRQEKEGINYLLSTHRAKFPSRKLNTKTIRQSVITNLLKEGKDVRLVQVFAGHKYPSTTEGYKQTDVEELKSEVLKYHPLS